MSSWMRKRFDSAESENGGHSVNCESPANSPAGDSEVINGVNKTSLSYETETTAALSPPGVPKGGVAKVKTQWQKAVRKLSVNSSGYSSSSNDPSPCISTSGSRTSMEKPGWVLRQQQNHYQPRSRHLSINAENGAYVHQLTSCATPIPESRTVNYCSRSRVQPSSLPPYAGQYMPVQPGLHPEGQKSRSPSGSSEEEESSGESDDRMTEEFPYGPAFKAAMGRVTAFPDGTEAVMIDSAVALEAFRNETLVMTSIQWWSCGILGFFRNA